MAKFKIGIKTTVAQLKKQFRDEVGGELRVYDGGRKADDSDLLVSLGATKGTLECRTSRTVGKFEEAMLKERNLKVKVFTKDDWVKVLDGITLSKVADIPRQAKKADMESLMSYQRSNAEANEADVADAVSVPEELVGMPIIDITLDSADIFHNYEEELENCGRFSWPAIAVLIYDAENGGTWVKSSTTDTDETMIAAREWIEEEYEYLDLGYDDLDEAFEMMEYYQSTSCKTYGINDVAKDSDELYSAIGVAMNQLYNGSDGGSHTNWYSWHLEAEKVLFRVRNNAIDHTEIFIVTSDEVFEPVDCTSEQVDELIRRFKAATWGNGSCFEGATDFCEGLAWVNLGGKWGLIDKSGKEVIKPTYDEVGCFSDGLVWVKLNEKYGFIDKSGKEIVKPKYEGAGRFSEGLAGVKTDGKYGYIDESGKVVIKPKYDGALPFSDGLAVVILDGKSGFIDKSGKEIVKPKYDKFYREPDFYDGFAKVSVDGKYGFIGKSGKEIVKPKYDSANDFSEGLAMVRADGKYGFIDKSGKEVIKPKYDSANDFNDGLALVELDGKYSFIDKSGKEVIKLKYDSAESFSEDLALVVLGKKRGFIDKSGKEVIKPKYDRAGSFSEGRAWVKLDWDYGFIDKTGKEVVKLKYEDASNFCNGLAKVGAGGGCCKVYGFIDKSGKEVIKPKYDNGSLEFSDGLVKVKLNGKCGFVDEAGKEVIKPKYDEAGGFSDGLAKVKIGDNYGFIDKNGNFAF